MGDIRGVGSIPGLEKSPGGRHGNPLQYSGLEKRLHRGAGGATVHGVTESKRTGRLGAQFASYSLCGGWAPLPPLPALAISVTLQMPDVIFIQS